MKKMYFALAAFLITAIAFSQGTITGSVIDGETNSPLPGANVMVKGTTNGTVTDFDGNFSINVSEGSGSLVISYIGFISKTVAYTSEGSLGSITLQPNAEELEGVVVVGTGVIDLVKERKTPVAASTIKGSEIQLKLGNLEFPEILNSTPSVYATKTGGGYGDGTLRVRGFGQVNTSVIINGQPVNDMENGRVFWSNWQGLSDISSGLQIQRGLGASKLAVPSVGGTITVVTKSTDKNEGGMLLTSVANDGYIKTVAGYDTGVNDKGWASSILLGRWQGDGYVDGTEGEGYTYLFSLGYKPSEQHAFNFTFTGSAQWHNQRTTRLSIRDYQNFGGDDFRKFNADWGLKDGKEYNFRRNFYNKPIGTLNWDWNINEKLSLSTSVYGSWGRGGGTGARGRNFGINPFRKDLTEAIADGNLPFRNDNGTIDFDAVVANNRAGLPYAEGNSNYAGAIIGTNTSISPNNTINENTAVRRASVNSHNWYGAISNLKYESNKWTFGAGIDLRTYTGFHYRVLNDLLGLDGYWSTGDRNLVDGKIITETIKASPFNDTGLNGNSKINYYNVGEVKWAGFNGIVEYSDDEHLSAVLQAGISNQSYKRIDYFASVNNVTSDKENKVGGYLKGGINYNIDEKHNVFFNAGRIERQPFFDAIFPNFANDINEDAENEQITSFELGYGFKSSFLDVSLNLYNTTWDNRFLSQTIRGADQVDDGTGTFAGIKQVHSGVELEFTARPLNGLRIEGMLSVGNWEYKDNVTASVFDSNQNLVDSATLFVDGAKVGDAAQTTATLGANYNVTDRFYLNLDWRYASDLYADFSFQLDTREWANDAQFLSEDNRGALELPSYNLFDLGAGYTFDLHENQTLRLSANVNNVLDTEYIAEGSSSIYTDDIAPEVNPATTVSTYKGIDTRNQVWFGFGRTWNVSLRYKF
ncbi:TonB-dependent receptor [uncultured Maribacter sp.]|uniref:TonB-dependent receptor n=1 Tax=uncultured Maribacter sp. TaxID=431308 RepID=UPI00260AEB46|nr:TonB-dependent receptor [uncultured Maribacter sp.]